MYNRLIKKSVKRSTPAQPGEIMNYKTATLPVKLRWLFYFSLKHTRSRSIKPNIAQNFTISMIVISMHTHHLPSSSGQTMPSHPTGSLISRLYCLIYNLIILVAPVQLIQNNSIYFVFVFSSVLQGLNLYIFVGSFTSNNFRIAFFNVSGACLYAIIMFFSSLLNSILCPFPDPLQVSQRGILLKCLSHSEFMRLSASSGCLFSLLLLPLCFPSPGSLQAAPSAALVPDLIRCAFRFPVKLSRLHIGAFRSRCSNIQPCTFIAHSVRLWLLLRAFCGLSPLRLFPCGLCNASSVSALSDPLPCMVSG